MIKIEFELDTEFGAYRDALYLPDDHTHTDAEIQAMKERRRDQWVTAVTLASQDPGPTEVPVQE